MLSFKDETMFKVRAYKTVKNLQLLNIVKGTHFNFRYILRNNTYYSEKAFIQKCWHFLQCHMLLFAFNSRNLRIIHLFKITFILLFYFVKWFWFMYIYPSIFLFEYISKKNVWFDSSKLTMVIFRSWNLRIFIVRMNYFYFKSKVTIFQKWWLLNLKRVHTYVQIHI